MQQQQQLLMCDSHMGSFTTHEPGRWQLLVLAAAVQLWRSRALSSADNRSRELASRKAALHSVPVQPQLHQTPGHPQLLLLHSIDRRLHHHDINPLVCHIFLPFCFLYLLLFYS
jgi:hypothetical protein